MTLLVLIAISNAPELAEKQIPKPIISLSPILHEHIIHIKWMCGKRFQLIMTKAKLLPATTVTQQFDINSAINWIFSVLENTIEIRKCGK